MLTLYAVAVLGLGIFGAHRYHLLYLRFRGRSPECPPAPEDWPVVTVQLPVYNERHVVDRLLRCVAALDYPRDRLEIQVLDDSTDDTTQRIAATLTDLRSHGLSIDHIRRSNREGFKAGALAHGLSSSQGEIVVIFDADFRPSEDVLRRLVPHFRDPKVGMVQARWGHLNRDDSLLTRAQALFLDGHFLIEHVARSRSGRFFNFNGTAGAWRRSCIDDAGGWQGDTLTEDLDLSYRAQLKGWRFLFLEDVVVPAELPATMNAYKAQQHRWAKGSIQTAMKLLPSILRAPVTLRQKVEAVFHLANNINYLLMLLTTVLVLPTLLLRWEEYRLLGGLLYFASFVFATASVAAFYGTAARVGGGRPAGPFRLLFLMALGIGLSVNNGAAVMEALRRHKTPFKRTPKRGVSLVDKGGRDPAGYRVPINAMTVLEAGLAAYFVFALTWAWGQAMALAIPFLLLFEVGFAYVVWGSVRPTRPRRLHSRARARKTGMYTAQGIQAALSQVPEARNPSSTSYDNVTVAASTNGVQTPRMAAKGRAQATYQG